jgi:SAM-dependent methyltransferase
MVLFSAPVAWVCSRRRSANLDGPMRMNFRLLLSKTFQSLKEVGLYNTLKTIRKELTVRHHMDDFDRRYGTETVGNESLWKLEVNSPNAKFGRRYGATIASDLQEAVKFIGVQPSEFTFIDLGSGKGRALVVAAELGFRNIIGIEFARELAEKGKENLARLKIDNASSIHGDAADFVFPEESMVVYFFNPFDNEVMNEVVQNLRAAYSKRPHDSIYLIYNRPKCASVINAADFLTCLGRPNSSSEVLIWKTVSMEC